MRRLASTVTWSLTAVAQPSMTAASSARPVSSSSSSTPRPRTVSTKEVSATRMVGQRQARLGLLGRRASGLDQQRGDGLGRLLVELVDGADGGGYVGDAQAAVEALDQLAVVDLERQRRQRQRVERLDHHPHDLDVVVERQLVAADDVDVGLGELAVAALLRPLAAPGRLDLEAPERELQLAGVLQDVARERHRQVEVQAQRRCRRALVVGVQPAQDVDLLVDLAALGEAVERLDDAGLDVGEAVQLEGARAGARSTSRSTARSAGRNSGKPLSGVGLDMVFTVLG